MSKEDPFEPLIAPRIANPNEKPAPVDWFERIAPRLPQASRPDRAVYTDEADPDGAKIAWFADVDLVAIEEKRIAGQSAKESPELAQLRRDAEDRAREIVQAALAQAKTITIETEKAAYHAGFQRGYADGERNATGTVNLLAGAEREALRSDVADFLERAEQARRQAWAVIEPQAIDLIFALCKQVLKQEIEVSRTAALEIIRNAIRRVSDHGTLRVKVSPDDLDMARSHRGELESLLDGNAQIEIVADRRIGAGGCVVETESGSIDARIETQTANIGEALEQVKLSTQN